MLAAYLETVALDGESVYRSCHAWTPMHWLGAGSVEVAYLETVALGDDSVDWDSALVGHDNSPTMAHAHLDRLELP